MFFCTELYLFQANLEMIIKKKRDGTCQPANVALALLTFQYYILDQCLALAVNSKRQSPHLIRTPIVLFRCAHSASHSMMDQSKIYKTQQNRFYKCL